MQKQESTYQTKYLVIDRIVWKCIKFELGVISIYLSRRFKTKANPRAVDLVLINTIMRMCISKSKVEQFDNEEAAAYQEITSSATYWHGTGRFQYKNDQIRDVLSEIVKSQSLKPAKDIFDPKFGEMLSISLARLRMYARIYADMHEYDGARKSRRYGSPRFWIYYFIMATVLQFVKEFKVWNPNEYRAQRESYRKSAAANWSIKVIKNPQLNAGLLFNRGSDIPGNYAILFGIREGTYEHAETSKGIELYESRVTSSISLKNITHLEVPKSYKKEVEKLLHEYGLTSLKVFAIEECEYYYSRQHFTDLVAVK